MANLHHHHQPDHDHGNPFVIPFILILAFAIVELWGGVWTQSLALLSDAWHMFSDVAALGVAMIAANQVAKSKQGGRVELMASSINAVMMLVVIAWIVIEAIERLQNPRAVTGAYVMLIALIGLVVNLVVAKHLHHIAHDHGGDKSLNQRAALLHVMGDILGSVAALLAGGIIYFTGWMTIDPILSLLIACVLLFATMGLIKDIGRTYAKQHE